jgi:sugar/nucleoside kinase (ribokinase family)
VLARPRPGRLDLLGVGECSLDTWLEVEALPAPGGKAAVLARCERAGGQVATATLAAAGLGLRAAYAGAVGDDGAGARALAGLRAAGVDCARVETVAGARTRTAVIAVEQRSGERIVLGHRDPRLDDAGGALAALPLDAVRLLLLDGSDPAVACALATAARAQGVPVVLDLDTPSPRMDPLLAAVEFPVVSESFAAAAGETAEETLRRLAAHGARLPVVTRGERGALAWWQGRPLASPAFEVGVVDTTGAGDVFHAALAWGLLQGLDAPQLLRHANAAAALACTGQGAQGCLPDAAALREFLAARGGAAAKGSGAYSSS